MIMTDYLKIARAALAANGATPKPAILDGNSVFATAKPEPDAAELALASAVLNRAGVRIMRLETGATIGVWSDLDGPELRAALHSMGADHLPIRYLDGAGVPMRYKVRRVEGEPVPMSVLAAMEQHPTEPWSVRDRMLDEMGWRSKGIPWAEWKAAGLNRLFQEQCTSGQPGRITAATVRHGERQALPLQRQTTTAVTK